MKLMLLIPTSTTTGKASATLGTTDSTSSITPSAAAPATIWLMLTDERSATTTAPTNDPALNTEYTNVKVASLPRSARSTKSGKTTLKL